ncbi:MAG: sugar ABC transporter substrate-binding protein [Kaistia sp. SCN 65-12]|nr:MAG: sugar ABC transporter substrate-binding protein [Kaistia sp. SCN 65-12]
MLNRRFALKCAFALSAVAAVMTAGPGFAEEKKFTIGYSQMWGTNPFLLAQAAGAEKAVKEWADKGVAVDMILTNAGDTDVNKQVADLEDLYARGVDGLLIFPGDSIVVGDPIVNLYNKGKIPVAITDIGIEKGDYVHFNITDNYKGGALAAQLMAKNVPAGAKVITFDHLPNSTAGQERRRGFEEEAAKLGLTVEPRKIYTLSLENSRRLMEDTLTSIPDVAGVFFMNQVGGQGAASALETLNKADSVKLVAFDLDPISYGMVKDGKLLGLVVQKPFEMGYAGMNNMVASLTGGEVQKDMQIEPLILSKETAADFANDPQVTGGK